MPPPSIIRRCFAPPPAPLRPFVERIWSWESDCPVSLPLLLPGTGSDLVFHYRVPFVAIEHSGVRHVPAAAHLFCLRTFSCRLAPQGAVGFVSVRFRASAIRHFGRLRMGDLIDRFPAAAEHFGAAVDELPAQLAALPDFDARAERVSRFLLARLEGAAPVVAMADRALDALYYGAPEAKVADLADTLGYSGRQLERLVGAAAGMSPKRFRRLVRLHHTVRHLLLTEEPDYLDASLERGYYDQAHFIHEMGDLTGRTPGQVFTPESFMSHFYNPRLPR